MLFWNAFESVLRVARAALASLLLVGVPLADAAACAGEELSAHPAAFEVSSEASVSNSGETTDHDGEPAGDAQHCIHGHCHHMTPFRTPDANVTPAESAAIEKERPHNQSTRVRATPGHERPPKT